MQVCWNGSSPRAQWRVRLGLLCSLLALVALGLLATPVQAQDEETTVYLPAIVFQDPGTPFPNELPLAARPASVQAVEAKVNALLPPDTPLEERDLLDELRQLSTALLDTPHALTTVVLTDTLTLQLILEDGSSILVVNNRPPGVDSQHVSAELTAQLAALENSPANHVAGSPRAVVTNFDGGDEVAAEVRAMLREAGYEIVSSSASIDAMRSSYKNLGALYLDTHGAAFIQVNDVIEDEDGSKRPIWGKTVYALQTSSEIDAATLLKNNVSELRAGEIVVSFVQDDAGWQAKLAVTEKFIDKHWSFDNGVVVIHSCFGGAQPFKPGAECKGQCFGLNDPGVYDPRPLRQAMLNKGADVVMSFDNFTSTGFARDSIVFFYDRMLGANAFKATANPPLRPFASDEVRKAMGDAGLLQFDSPKRIFFNRIGVGGNTVNVTFDTKAPGGLAPSIQTVDVVDDAGEPQGELTLAGNFGDKQGTVEVDGIQATIQSWTESEIVVKTPFSGAGATGDLVVKAPGQVESNPVPITEWRGTFAIDFTPNKGTLFAEATMDLHFRADLHRYRTTIDGEPRTRTVDAYISGDSTGTIYGTGTHVIGSEYSTIWTGGGVLEPVGKQAVDMLGGEGSSMAADLSAAAPDASSNNTAGLFGGIVTLDPEANTARLCLHLSGTYDQILTVDGQQQTLAGPLTLPFVEGMQDYKKGMLACYNLPLRNNYVIPAGERTVNLEGGAVYRIRWTDFQPSNPPTAQTPG